MLGFTARFAHRLRAQTGETRQFGRKVRRILGLKRIGPKPLDLDGSLNRTTFIPGMNGDRDRRRNRSVNYEAVFDLPQLPKRPARA